MVARARLCLRTRNATAVVRPDLLDHYVQIALPAPMIRSVRVIRLAKNAMARSFVAVTLTELDSFAKCQLHQVRKSV